MDKKIPIDYHKLLRVINHVGEMEGYTFISGRREGLTKYLTGDEYAELLRIDDEPPSVRDVLYGGSIATTTTGSEILNEESESLA